MQENEFRMEEFQLISVCSGSLRRINTLRPKEKKNYNQRGNSENRHYQ